jgi:hypothetical protein
LPAYCSPKSAKVHVIAASERQRAKVADDCGPWQKSPRTPGDFAISSAAGNLEKVVSGALTRLAANRGRRGHADDWHKTPGTLQPGHAKLVVMAVDDKLGANTADQSAEPPGVGEAAPDV